MTLLLALVPPQGHVGFMDNFSYQAAGLVVVIFSLTFLSAMVAVVGRLLQLPLKKESVSPVVPSAAPVMNTDIPPEIVAVLAAAVAVTIRKPHRILQIQPANNPWLQAWASEGRRQIFQSHQVR